VYNHRVASEPLYVCDGPACRLRARDLELTIPRPQRVPCIGRCDGPVAAFTVAGDAPRVLARELMLVRRGADPQPAAAPGAQRGPHEPVRLRDLLLSDQPDLDMARRRGAYRGIEAPVELGQLLPDAWPANARAAVLVVDAGGGKPGQFALRPICERDPHAVIAGMLIAARSARSTRASLRLRQPWLEARRALERAIADAVAAGLTADVTLTIVDGDAPAPADALAVTAELIVALPHILQRDLSWWTSHPLRLCAISGDVLRPGVYELPGPTTVADAIAAAGGVVDGPRTSTVSSFLADGVAHTGARLDLPAPEGLIVAHARRDPFQL
jgi:hypothetical protein